MEEFESNKANDWSINNEEKIKNHSIVTSFIHSLFPMYEKRHFGPSKEPKKHEFLMHVS